MQTCAKRNYASKKLNKKLSLGKSASSKFDSTPNGIYSGCIQKWIEATLKHIESVG